MVLGVLLVLASSKRNNIKDYSAFKQFKYMQLIILLAFASIPFGIWPRFSLVYFFDNYTKTLILFFMILLLVCDVHDLKKLLWA